MVLLELVSGGAGGLLSDSGVIVLGEDSGLDEPVCELGSELDGLLLEVEESLGTGERMPVDEGYRLCPDSIDDIDMPRTQPTSNTPQVSIDRPSCVTG